METREDERDAAQRELDSRLCDTWLNREDRRAYRSRLEAGADPEAILVEVNREIAARIKGWQQSQRSSRVTPGRW
jgi:hypothetical protein